MSLTKEQKDAIIAKIADGERELEILGGLVDEGCVFERKFRIQGRLWKTESHLRLLRGVLAGHLDISEDAKASRNKDVERVDRLIRKLKDERDRITREANDACIVRLILDNKLSFSSDTLSSRPALD